MSVLTDLINQIDDVALRERIQKEVNKLAKQKKFGLVFEEHMPECTPLYDMPIKAGSTVANCLDERCLPRGFALYERSGMPQ